MPEADELEGKLLEYQLKEVRDYYYKDFGEELETFDFVLTLEETDLSKNEKINRVLQWAYKNLILDNISAIRSVIESRESTYQDFSGVTTELDRIERELGDPIDLNVERCRENYLESIQDLKTITHSKLEVEKFLARKELESKRFNFRIGIGFLIGGIVLTLIVEHIIIPAMSKSPTS